MMIVGQMGWRVHRQVCHNRRFVCNSHKIEVLAGFLEIWEKLVTKTTKRVKSHLLEKAGVGEAGPGAPGFYYQLISTI